MEGGAALPTWDELNANEERWTKEDANEEEWRRMRAEPLYTVMGGPHYGGPLRMGDPSVWPDNVWDASGERHHQWSESPKYRWLDRSLDTLLDIKFELVNLENWFEDYNRRNEGPLQDPPMMVRGRSGPELGTYLENNIVNMKKRIARLKQTILVLMGPEPSPVPLLDPLTLSGEGNPLQH